MTQGSRSTDSYDAVVIGGGFFGVEIALELRRMGLHRVLVVEREGAIMQRASFVNQARVHNGYHYPRSITTAERSHANFETFVTEYADAVVGSMRKVYAIAAGSRVSPGQFERFCRTLGVPCDPAPARTMRLFDRALVPVAFHTRELAFCSVRIAARLLHSLRDAGVDLMLRTRARILGSDAAAVALDVGGRRVRAHHVVNCTYASLAETGVALRSGIRRELTEMVLLAPPPELEGVGVTVMDGPFFSTMPFPSAGAHSLSHVRYTPHAAAGPGGPELTPRRSNREAMLRDSQRFMPCLAGARVLGSLFETKATLARNEGDDGRPVLIERAEAAPRVISVLGAKIDNVYDVRAFLRTQDWQMAA